MGNVEESEVRHPKRLNAGQNSSRAIKWFAAVSAFLVALTGLLNTPAVQRFLHLEPPRASLPANHAITPPMTNALPPLTHVPSSSKPPSQSVIVNPPRQRAKQLESVPSDEKEQPKEVDPSQHCEIGSVCIGRDNNGSVEIHVEKPNASKRILSSTAARRAYEQLSKAPKGQAVTFLVARSSQETVEFSRQLAAVFEMSGWVIHVSSGTPSIYYRSPSGTEWSWEGKGLVCMGFQNSDESALIAIRALASADFPCQVKPNDVGLPNFAGTITLMVGTRNANDEDD